MPSRTAAEHVREAPYPRNQGSGLWRRGPQSRPGRQYHGGPALAGGRGIVEYTQMLEEARRHAVDRMVKNARLMQANAIVMMRFDSSEMGQTMSEVVAWVLRCCWRRYVRRG